MIQSHKVKDFFSYFQNVMCESLCLESGSHQFASDVWQHASGGGGDTRTLADDLYESAGVNFSHVKGSSLPNSASSTRKGCANAPFDAMGVSIVIHPRNPYIPTSHMNIRLLVAHTAQGPVWWFGGGFDLTPYYGFAEDCVLWHQAAKKACDSFELGAYEQYKKNCDNYFYLKHRAEWRGIGGIFFDDVNHKDFDDCFAFIRHVAQAYMESYLAIIRKRKLLPYSEQQRQFQCYRRGRYVEFNLLYDRGTTFGLQSGGRTESILMSLPPVVNWQYQYEAEPGSIESCLLSDYLTPRDWLASVTVT